MLFKNLDSFGWLLFGLTVLISALCTTVYSFQSFLGMDVVFRYGNWLYGGYTFLFLRALLAIFFIRQIFLSVKKLKQNLVLTTRFKILQGLKISAAIIFLLSFSLIFITGGWRTSGYTCDEGKCWSFGYSIAGHRLSEQNSEIYSLIINSVIMLCYVIFLSATYAERRKFNDQN